VNNHLLIAPIIVPLVVGALQLLAGDRRPKLSTALGVGSCLILLVVSAMLMALASNTTDGAALAGVYQVGDWPAPFGIVLVADRLSVLMVTLTSLLGLATLHFSLGRWVRLGQHYNPLFQFLLMGLNGAFLTGDLFNLFVFFEVLLAASYGLTLHGSGPKRVGASLHYIVINLAASMLFLIGVSLIFGVTGTLNMAALAERIPTVPENTRNLLHAGAAILGVAFLVKAAMWPMGFWLPRTYDAAAPPVAAMFAIMTKLGVYILLRLSGLLFGEDAGPSAGFGQAWLLCGGLATLVVGMIGMLAAKDLGRMAGYSLLVSAGTLLGAVGYGDPAVIGGALFYLVASTLGAAAFFLLAGLIAPDGADEVEDTPVLEAYNPSDGTLFAEEDETVIVISAPEALLSATFLACTLLVAGLPPLPGFIAKFAMLAPMIGTAHPSPVPGGGTVLFVLVILSSLCALIAMVRAGIQIFWVEHERVFPTIRVAEMAPVIVLLALSMALTIAADWPLRFMRTAAEQVHTPQAYVGGVLGPPGTAP
jgi:multicomponent K+:H+ antiporter subunit D